MSSSGHGNFWSSSDGGSASTTPVSAGQVSSSTKGDLLSALNGGSAYQAMEIEAKDSDNEASTDAVLATEDFLGVKLLSAAEENDDKTSRLQVIKKKFDYGSDDADDEWMLNVWGLSNVAVMMSYFSVGFARCFLATPLSYYAVYVLGASPAQQNVLLTLGKLPWSFKLLYGFVSDNFPIRGMRRKPYFVIGWTVYVLVNFIMATQEGPSLQLLACHSLVSTMGFLVSDVAADAILVERSKHEPRETRGRMQATAINVVYVGSILGTGMGMVFNIDERCALSVMSIRKLFVLNGLIPVLCIVPFAWHLRETAFTCVGDIPVKQRIWKQSVDVFRALEQKAVYGPMALVFVYNALQVPNAAWKSFLVDGLNFSSCQLGVLAFVGALMACLGVWMYKTFFFDSSWRKVYIWTTWIVAFFSAFQLLLIFRVNKALGISDLAFSIGDDSIADLLISIQFLPIARMYISMCPNGVEGTTYAILTTMGNVSSAVAYNVGTLITKIWDVGNEAFSAGDFRGMWKLTLLTSLVQPLPLFLIRLLPANVAEQRALQASGIRNKWGGIVLLTALFVSLGWTVILSIIELV